MVVFLSHNKKDKEAARTIGLFLIAEDVSVWLDEWEIAAGDSIVGQIQRGLRDCTHFLVLWSKNAQKSRWLRRELEAALSAAIDAGTPRVIAIRLDDTPLPPLLADLKYLRYDGGTEKDRAEIIESVCFHRPSFDFIRAIVKKYREVITDTDDDHFGLLACPQCGSLRLKRSEFMDYAGDEIYYSIECKECNWSDWTQ